MGRVGRASGLTGSGGDDMDVSGPLARMDALQRGVEELWGMSLEEYAELCVDDPEEAQRVADRAQERLTNKLTSDTLASEGNPSLPLSKE